MSDAVKQYVSDLCDKYAHFGEFHCQELLDQERSKYSVTRAGCSHSMTIKVLNRGYGVGPVFSAAIGKVLGAPPDYYEKLYRLFKAEKDRRNAL
jgi:hypothetical protein